MTALILQTASFIEMAAPKMRALYLRFSHALDAFAAAKARKAVPERQLHKIQREINRYHRQMHPELKSSAKTARPGR
jgi:hypothetical protein